MEVETIITIAWLGFVAILILAFLFFLSYIYKKSKDK